MQQTLIIFNPSIEDGGVEKNLYLITNYLSTKIKKIELISWDISKKKYFSKKISFISPFKKQIDINGRKIKYFFCLILLLINLLKNQNKIVFAFQANLYATFICWILNIKIITRSNTSSKGWSKNNFKNFLYKFLISKATKVIVNSYFFKIEMDKKFKIKTILIENPFDFDLIKKKSNNKIYENFDKNKINLISVGRLTDQKNHIMILKAINNAKNKARYFLRIIGKGVEKNNLQNYIDKNNLKKQIRLLGYKNNPFPYIKKSDFFILSSKFEGSPNVLVEAGYLGTNIISTDCPTGPKEILNDGQFGKLIKNNNEKSLSNFLENIKKNKFQKKSSFRKYLKKKFSLKKSLKKYLLLIYEVSKI